jgi:hypothetical protein
MQISGKSLLPRLGASATIPPSPHAAEPWMSDSRARTRLRPNHVIAPVSALQDGHPRGSIPVWQQSIVNFALSIGLGSFDARFSMPIALCGSIKPQSCKSAPAHIPSRNWLEPGARRFHTRRHFARIALWLGAPFPFIQILGGVRRRCESRPRAPLRARTECGNILRTARPDAAIRVRCPAR